MIAVIVSEPWSTGLLCLAMWGLCYVLSRLGETPTSNDLRAAYCARCRRVAFLGESILCPACVELRKGGAV